MAILQIKRLDYYTPTAKAHKKRAGMTFIIGQFLQSQVEGGFILKESYLGIDIGDQSPHCSEEREISK
ncbi:hypothetical protein AI19_15310 [Thalassolituus oleivorans 4BN06-13]|jgi:hypothetical protein|nr:hypothetical protein [Thalassolituus oleivorans 4BN06-13]